MYVYTVVLLSKIPLRVLVEEPIVEESRALRFFAEEPIVVQSRALDSGVERSLEESRGSHRGL